MSRRGILIAVDSVGIDPLGHSRAESVYAESRFLFPRECHGDLLALPDAPVQGALVETDVTDDLDSGAIECAITYTSIFSGESAVREHGLMQGLGLRESTLERMIERNNLFGCFKQPCLANAVFPGDFPFLGESYVADLVPAYPRAVVEDGLRFRGQPIGLKGRKKHGFAELYTLTEINQNIFVHAAREARVSLRTYDDVRADQALTASMTHELEAEFNFEFFDQRPLPIRAVDEAADILVHLSQQHDFTFYKYQIPDLVSHTGRVESAREVFAVIEQFVEGVLRSIDPAETVVVVTSYHGHLEQVAYSHGHPKSKVPTWYFGPDAERHANTLRRPEAIFHEFADRN